MKKIFSILFLIVAFCLVFLPDQIFSKTERIRLYVPEGQVYTRSFRVYVPNVEITEDMSPCLFLEKTAKGSKKHAPIEVAPNQQWTEEGKDAKSGIQTGTLLLFDLKEKGKDKLKIPFYKSYKRVLPILRWTDSQRTREDELPKAVSERDVVLGNPLGATLWSAFIMMLFLLGSFLLVKQLAGQKLVKFVTLGRERVSLSLFQMALWTVAIGFMVICCGIMKMHVPYIPDTLLWLMGLSGVTGAAGHWQGHQLQEQIQTAEQKKAKKNAEKNSSSQSSEKGNNPKKQESDESDESNKLATMLTINVKGEECLSLAKIQLLLWTVVTIIIFFVKSYLHLQLWEVPYQLVILMGVSQAGFIGRNYMAVEEFKKDNKKDGEQQGGQGGDSSTGKTGVRQKN